MRLASILILAVACTKQPPREIEKLVEQLVELCADKSGGYIPGNYYTDVCEALVAKGEACIPHVIPLLGGDAGHWAGYILSMLGEPAVEALLPLRRHPDPLVREAAFEVLGAFEREELVLPGLKDPVGHVRAAAAGALDSVAALITALGDEAAAGRAAEVLAQIGPEAAPAVPALERALEYEDEEARRNAAVALGKIGAAAAPAADTLARLLADEDWIAREYATVALAQIGAVSALRDALADPSRRRLAARAIAQCRGDTEELCRDMLINADFVVRFSGARGLAYRQRDDPRVLPVLREGLRLDDPDQVVFAADALAAMGPPALAALPDLYDAIGRLQKANLRGIAVQSLWRSLEGCVHEIGRHDLVALEQGLRHESSFVRAYVEKALAKARK